MTAYTNIIYEFEGDATLSRGNFTWKGKAFIWPKKARPVYGFVDFDDIDFTAYLALVATRNDIIGRNNQKLAEGVVDPALVGGSPLAGDGLETVPSVPAYTGDQTLTVKVYGDGTLISTVTVYDTDPFRLGTAGVRAKKWEFEIIGNVPNLRAMIASSSMREMKG